MRILFLDQFSELGGAQHALLDTVDAVQLAGWEPRVLVPGRGPLVEALQSRRVPVGEIPCGPYALGTQERRGFAAIHAGLAAAGPPDRRTDCEREHRSGLRKWPTIVACRGAGGAAQNANRVSRPQPCADAALRLARWSLRRAAATRRRLQQVRVNSRSQRKQHVIPNGVRDAGYRERGFDGAWRIGDRNSRPHRSREGAAGICEAAAVLKDEFPQARFVICGAPLFDSVRGYFDAVRLRARGLPVEFVEWQRDVGRVLHELDLLVVPSHQEGMARIVLEAFSAGVPVVAFPAGGIPEAVMDGVTGFLTSRFTAEALAARIRDVMANRMIAAKCGKSSGTHDKLGPLLHARSLSKAHYGLT